MIIGIAVVLGAIFGSFLNVVIYRVPRGASIVRPPSACGSCGTPIAPRDNIPLLSYVLLRGRCRQCGARISVRYPLVEAAMAAVAAGAIARFGAGEAAAYVAVGGAVLLVLALIDLEHRRVPNVIVLPATAALGLWVVVLSAVRGRWSIAGWAIGCAAAGFLLFLLIALVSGGMGMGDVKLAAYIGLYAGAFGWEVFVLAVFAAFFLGGIAGVVLLVLRRRGRKDAIPFAPALAAGALLAVYWGSGPVRAWLHL